MASHDSWVHVIFMVLDVSEIRMHLTIVVFLDPDQIRNEDDDDDDDEEHS